jgi:hypothetical protein
MNIQYKRLAIIVNRLSGELQPIQRDELRNSTKADWVIDLPENTELAELGRNGHGIWPISPNNPVVVGLNQLLSNAGIGSQPREY